MRLGRGKVLGANPPYRGSDAGPASLQRIGGPELVPLFGGDRQDDGVGRGIGLGTEAGLDALAGDKDDVLDDADFFKEPDGPGGGVGLFPAHPVTGGAGKGVVVVVPALAHGEDAEEEIVAALVRGVELAAAEGVADGVHGPSDVLVKEEADETSPDQAGEGAEPGRVAHQLGGPGADKSGQGETGENPKPKGVVDESDDGVLQHGAGVLLDVGLEVVQDPTDVRMPETFEGRVGIILVVGVGVVLGVGGGPMKSGPLHSHGAKNEKDAFEPRLGLKGFVGEHTMESQGNAEGASRVHEEEKTEIHP